MAASTTVKTIFIAYPCSFSLSCGGQKASTAALEPITSIFVGVLLLHETLTLRIALGSALTLAASALITVFDGRKAPAPGSAPQQ